MGNGYFRDRALLQTICALALPTVVEQALQTVVQYVDTAMVGRIGASASAAVGLTATMTWLVNGPCFAMGIGVLSCISKAAGARDAAKIRAAAVQSLYITVVMGILAGAASLAVSPFLPGWLGADAAIRRDAFLYFFIISLPMLFRVSGIVFGSVLRAVGDTKTPMLINTLMNVCNIALNYFLIGGSRTVALAGLQIPVWGAGLGVAGAAAATAISHVVGGSLMFAALLKNPQLSPRGERLRIDGPVMKECVLVGLPIAVERSAACLGQVVFTGMVTRLGTLAIAAHSIALTAEQAFYVPGYGMQAAAATLSGNAVGERDERKLTHVAVTITAIAVAVMGLLATALFFFPAALMAVFTGDRQVVALGASALRIVAVSEPLFAVVIILEGVFNGVGETKAPFLFSVVSMWGVRLTSTWLCVCVLGLGLRAVWVCMVADNVTRCILLSARFFRGKWKKKFDFTVKPEV